MFICSFVHLFIYSFIHSAFNRPVVQLFSRSFVCSYIQLFIHYMACTQKIQCHFRFLPPWTLQRKPVRLLQEDVIKVVLWEKITSCESLGMSISNFSGHMQSIKLNISATVLTLGLRRLEIVFIFTGLVLQILFQTQFALSYQCEIYHRHKWNVTKSVHYIFSRKPATIATI